MVITDRVGASAAIANGRGDHLARKGPRRHAGALRHPRSAGLYLRAERETERAATELAEARRLRGEGYLSSIARIRARYWGVPKIRALHEATLFAGLRKAGMPEE